MEKYLRISRKIWLDEDFRCLFVNRWMEKSRTPRSYPWPFEPLPERESICLEMRNRFKKIRKKILPVLLRKFHYKCACCKSKENLVPDHVLPICYGGTNDLFNLQILCGYCNSKKSGILTVLTKKQRSML